MKKAITVIVILFLFSLKSNFAQDAIWRDHLPYNMVISVAEAGNIIYAATPYSIFYLNKTDNSINRLNKINGLSDVGISSIKYQPELKVLVIAYSNANIDLLMESNIVNLSDIKDMPILGNKTINHIYFIGKRAYLACGFGIVVLDVEREEFPDPIYYIGPEGSAINVNDITYNPSDSLIYAATDIGVYSAHFYGTNLANYADWSHDFASVLPAGPFNLIASFNNRIYLNKKGPGYSADAMFVKINGEWSAFEPNNTSNRKSFEVVYNRLLISSNLAVDVYKEDFTREYTIYSYNPGNVVPLDAILDKDNAVWIGDEYEGLTKVTGVYTSEKMRPEGPDFPDVYDMSSAQNEVWVVPGGRNSSFGNLYRSARFAGFTDGKWVTIDRKKDTILDDARDILNVAVDPSNPKRVYLGSWGYGLFEYTNGVRTNHFTDANSSLELATFGGSWIGIGGLDFDANNNLWVSNSSAAPILSVKKSNGEWKSFNLGSVATGVDADKLMVDNNGYKWIMMRDHALVVFNDNNTIDNIADDQVKKLTGAIGNGALPGQIVKCLAVDKQGEVWIGTDEGIGVFKHPENIFPPPDGDFDCATLLISENITAILVDGNNRKWIGTEQNGLFLLSEDGTVQVYHYTIENSPLFSNSITSLAMLSNGEVYIGTGKGILSYIESANGIDPLVNSKENYELRIYPNPTNDYVSINIVLKSSENIILTITDISGKKVLKENFKGYFGDNHKTIYVGHLINGIYLMNIQINQISNWNKLVKI